MRIDKDDANYDMITIYDLYVDRNAVVVSSLQRHRIR
jgi:hypothetical protein